MYEDTQRITLELVKQVVLMFTVHEFNSRAFEGGGFDQVMTTVFLISHLRPIFIPRSDLLTGELRKCGY